MATRCHQLLAEVALVVVELCSGRNLGEQPHVAVGTNKEVPVMVTPGAGQVPFSDAHEVSMAVTVPLTLHQQGRVEEPRCKQHGRVLACVAAETGVRRIPPT
jgi:hypothetical protein